MSTSDPTTVAELDRALARLTDSELGALVARMSRVAHTFVDRGSPRVADVFAALAVLGAEQQDRRRELAEHARLQLDGPEVGGLLGEDEDPFAG